MILDPSLLGGLALSLFGNHHNPSTVTATHVQQAATASGLSTTAQSTIISQAAAGNALPWAVVIQELAAELAASHAQPIDFAPTISAALVKKE